MLRNPIVAEAGDKSLLYDVIVFGPKHCWSQEDDLTGVKGVAASAFGRTFCDPVTLLGPLEQVLYPLRKSLSESGCPSSGYLLPGQLKSGRQDPGPKE